MWGWLPCCSVSLSPVPGTAFLFLLWWGGIVCWHRPTLPASAIHLGYNTRGIMPIGHLDPTNSEPLLHSDERWLAFWLTGAACGVVGITIPLTRA
jgi:hypothetical protein